MRAFLFDSMSLLKMNIQKDIKLILEQYFI